MPRSPGADSLADWSAVPQVPSPLYIPVPGQGQDRKGSETLPLLILSPPIQRDSGHPFPRFSHAADRLAAGDLPHGFVEEANLGQGSGTDAGRQL